MQALCPQLRIRVCFVVHPDKHNKNLTSAKASAVFAAALAAHDFRGLPHVNSPANLVKNLIGFGKK